MNLAVSDHAVLRFLERAHGLDVEAIRAALAGELARAGQAAGFVGCGEFAIKSGGLTYCVRDRTVVTVLGRFMRANFAEPRR